MTKIFEILRKAGLSEYQARAYSVLVSDVSFTALEISKRSNIPSSKVYEVMASLVHKGFASIIKQKPLTFAANDMRSALKSDIKQKVRQLHDLEKDVDMLSLPDKKTDQFAIVYGKDAFFANVKESVSKSDRIIVAVVNSFKIDKALCDLLSDFVIRGGSVYFLGPMTKDNQPRIKELKRVGVQIKHFIPDSTRFTVWDEQIVTIGLKDTGQRDYYSLWVQNEFLGKTLTAHFMQLWDSAI